MTQKVIDLVYKLDFIINVKTVISVILLILFFSPASAQVTPDSVWERAAMEKLMALMNLRLSDLTFRDDYTAKDSFRLETIARLMRRPFGMVEFVEQYKDNCTFDKPEPLLNFAYENLAKEGQTWRGMAIDNSKGAQPESGQNLFYKSSELNRFLTKVHRYLYNVFPPSAESTFSLISSDEKRFLLNEFKANLMEDTADEYRTVDQIDSIAKTEEEYIKRFVKFGTRIRKDFIIAAGIEAAVDLHREINLFLADVAAGRIDPATVLGDTVILPPRVENTAFLGKDKRWRIGGTGDDYYKGEYDFILDLGGNDRYDLSYSPQKPHGTIIIDLGGNDIYSGMTDFTIGSGCLSAGLLFDMGGDDIYNGNKFSCGSGYFGFGFLYDRSGNDKYYGDTHAEAAGTFGLGVLIDAGGSDLYSAALHSQGFAAPEGIGVIADYSGNDTYVAGNKYKDVLRYADHYLSLSQGFAYGFRPYMSGGIGAIIDFVGNDTYISDIFAQGTSYWWSLGLIYDSSGNDQYISYQYAQGAATHMTLGILLEQSGNDIYFGKGLMQGCGHDYSCGIMLDRNGNDIYHAYDLSQAAGSANGFGILIDDRGDDAYYVMRKNNTQGFGDARRDFGSMGLFLDLSGSDRYDGNGADRNYWQSPSKWGGGMDWEFVKPDSMMTIPK
ncbi:MAG: hypothetical protein NT002_08250 [candidate division Zixibacteria bacterium]|nr:hypothetical protein [candidate division Zixibacteria bacterium]